jgi:hypothetical protein
MAWSSTQITAQEISDRADDFPIFLGTHALYSGRSLLGQKWVATDSGVWTDSDIADADGPVTRTYDGFHHTVTYPNTTGTGFTFVINDNAGAMEFDSIAITGHNFGTLGSSTVNVDIADDAAFTTNLETIATFSSISTDKRLIELDLFHTGSTALRYSSVQYVRIRVTLGSSGTPEIGQVVLSRRRQMGSAQLLPYDDDWETSAVGDFVARSGVTSRYVFHKGKALRNATFLTEDAAQATAVTDFWNDIEFGTRSFIYLECPNSDEQNGLVMLMSTPELQFPYSSDKVRRVRFDMVEQPPFYSSEE